MSQHGVIHDEEAARHNTSDLAEKKETSDEARTPSVASNDSNTPVAMDWDSPDDSGNPKNWPTWKRVYHTSIPALFGFVM